MQTTSRPRAKTFSWGLGYFKPLQTFTRLYHAALLGTPRSNHASHWIEVPEAD